MRNCGLFSSEMYFFKGFPNLAWGAMSVVRAGPVVATWQGSVLSKLYKIVVSKLRSFKIWQEQLSINA